MSHTVTPGLELEMFGKGKKTLNRVDLVELRLLDAVLLTWARCVDPTLPVTIERVDFGQSPNKQYDYLKGLVAVGDESVRFHCVIDWCGLVDCPNFPGYCIRRLFLSLDGSEEKFESNDIYSRKLESTFVVTINDKQKTEWLDNMIRELHKNR